MLDDGERGASKGKMNAEKGDTLILGDSHKAEAEGKEKKPTEDEGDSRLNAEKNGRTHEDKRVAQEKRIGPGEKHGEEGSACDPFGHVAHIFVVALEAVSEVAFELFNTGQKQPRANEEPQEKKGPNWPGPTLEKGFISW